ncbi:hypothetical protein C8Q78DRAFT_995596 [Trametes maxima]|nr:hypothetical protein C8Q78DRAFT_995596 [Trametes maxima]
MAARTTRTGRIFSPYEIVHSDVDISVLVAEAIANAEDHAEGDDPIQGLEGDSLSSDESEDVVVDQGPRNPETTKEGKRRRRCLRRLQDAPKDPFGEGAHPNIGKHAASIPAFKMDVQLESLPSPREHEHIWTVEELLADGFSYVTWDGIAPFALLDCEGRVVGGFPGRPNDPSWDSVVEDANKAMKKAAAASKFKPHQVKHRRGNYSADDKGISYGGGQQGPGDDASRWLWKQHVGHVRPQGPQEHEDQDGSIYKHDPSLRINFTNSIFPGAAFNFGPVTLVVEFPPGSSILLMSAVVLHANTPIQDGETRMSFTQYCAGGLLRWVDSGFRTQGELAEQSPQAKMDFDAMTFSMGSMEAVDLPQRPKEFPPLYTVPNHVKAPKFGTHGGKIYLVLMDLSPKALQATYDFIKGASIPEGTEEGIRRSGFAPIGPGDCLLARDINGSLQEADDKIICWVTPRPPGAVVAHSWAKTDGGPLTPTRSYVTARLGSTAMNLGAPDVAALLRERAEAVNFPRIGSRDNCYFSTMQLTSARQGCRRRPCIDLHGNEDPGIFVLLTFGVYIQLDGLVSCCFSGRYTHGGFPPTARPGTAPDPRSYRVVIVSYPQEAAFDTVGKYTWRTSQIMPRLNSPVRPVTPNLMDAALVSLQPPSPQTGLPYNSDALMNFVGRALVQLSHRVLQEIAPDLKVAFDATQLTPPAGVQHWEAAFKRSIEFYPELMETGLREKHGLPVLTNTTATRAMGSAKEKGKARPVAQPKPVKKGGGRKRGRGDDDITAVSNKGRVNAVHAVRFSNPPWSWIQRFFRGCVRLSAHCDKDRNEDNNEGPYVHDEDGEDEIDNDKDDDDVLMQDESHRDSNFTPSGPRKLANVQRRGRGPALLSPHQYAKVWARPPDSNGGTNDDGEEVERESSVGDGETALEGGHTRVDAGAPHAKFLSKLALPYLQRFLALVQRDVQNLGDNGPCSLLPNNMRPAQFIKSFISLDQRNNFHDLQIQMVRGEYMLAVTAAWTWLDVDIPSLAFGLLNGQVAETIHNKWLSRLLADIRAQLSAPRTSRTPLKSSSYLNLATTQTYTVSSKESVPHNACEDVWNTAVVRLLCSALAAFLKFPNTQSRMQAAFIRHMLSALAMQTFSSFLASLNLAKQPLADRKSSEHATLVEVSNNLETLRDLWRQFGGYGGVPTLPGHPIGSDAYTEAFNSAAAALAAFLKELYPLLSSSLPTPLSTMQQSVHVNRDFLLPFRQHAPEVANAFSPHGCLFVDNVDKPGAIASLWCLRGIFYRTRFSSEHPQSLFFPDYAAWQAKYTELCADPQVTFFNQGKDRYFCNARAYGQATTRSTEHAEAYFSHEDTWLAEFEGMAPEWRMPFRNAYLFTQRKDGKGHKLLPQLGSLTGMLITADLVYAGKVAMPSATEMGEMVYLLSKGAGKCLQHFRLLSKTSSKSDTILVFETLYNSVYNSLTAQERSDMTYDPIMFEHTLCKYQRCHEV